MTFSNDSNKEGYAEENSNKGDSDEEIFNEKNKYRMCLVFIFLMY